jgi:hypothetical protein
VERAFLPAMTAFLRAYRCKRMPPRKAAWPARRPAPRLGVTASVIQMPTRSGLAYLAKSINPRSGFVPTSVT